MRIESYLSCRRSVKSVVVAVLVGSVLGPGAGVVGAASEGFSDLDAAGVHRSAVEGLAADGVFVGTECGPGEFCPGDAVERWVMAVWLVRILDGADPAAVGVSRFSDVDASQWWAPYVERLADLGVTGGCATEPARFCPAETVTRARMASFLVRAFELPVGRSGRFVDTGGKCPRTQHRRSGRGWGNRGMHNRGSASLLSGPGHQPGADGHVPHPQSRSRTATGACGACAVRGARRPRVQLRHPRRDPPSGRACPVLVSRTARRGDVLAA